MDPHGAIILPASFKFEVPVAVLAGDPVVEIPPILLVHGVEETSFRIFPTFDSFGRGGLG